MRGHKRLTAVGCLGNTLEIAFLPGWCLDQLTGAHARLSLNYCISALLVLLLLDTSAMANVVSAIPHTCLMRYLLGIPCPGCGMTTSLIAFTHGELRTAWVANPADVILGVHLILQVVCGATAVQFGKAELAALKVVRSSGRMACVALFLVWLIRIA